MIRIDQSMFGLRRLPWWQVALIASIGLAVIVALAIVTAGLILLLAPVIFLAILIRRLTAPRSTQGPETPADRRPQVIEAEYEIMDAPPDRRDRDGYQ